MSESDGVLLPHGGYLPNCIRHFNRINSQPLTPCKPTPAKKDSKA